MYFRGYLVENPIQTLIIRCHIVFAPCEVKTAWAACGLIPGGGGILDISLGGAARPLIP